MSSDASLIRRTVVTGTPTPHCGNDMPWSHGHGVSSFLSVSCTLSFCVSVALCLSVCLCLCLSVSVFLIRRTVLIGTPTPHCGNAILWSQVFISANMETECPVFSVSRVLCLSVSLSVCLCLSVCLSVSVFLIRRTVVTGTPTPHSGNDIPWSQVFVSADMETECPVFSVSHFLCLSVSLLLTACLHVSVCLCLSYQAECRHWDSHAPAVVMTYTVVAGFYLS